MHGHEPYDASRPGQSCDRSCRCPRSHLPMSGRCAWLWLGTPEGGWPLRPLQWLLDVDPAHSAVAGDDDGLAGRDAPYRMDTHSEVKRAAVTIDPRPLSESPPWRSELPEIAVGTVDRSCVADACRTVIERAMTL